MVSTPFDPMDEMRFRARAEAFPHISIQKIAEQYSVSLRTLRRWQKDGLMPPRKKHGRWLKYWKTHIAALMAARGISAR